MCDPDLGHDPDLVFADDVVDVRLWEEGEELQVTRDVCVLQAQEVLQQQRHRGATTATTQDVL